MLHKTQDACSLSEDSVLFTQTMQLRLCGRLPGKSSCSLWRSVWPLSARAQISLQFELGPCMPFYLGQVVRAARPGGPASSAACEDTPKTSLLGSSQVNVVGFATGGASASCTVHGILPAFRKDSLSQSTCHGPCAFTGRRLCTADTTFPAFKS